MGSLILTECNYEPGSSYEKHSHVNPYFIFILSGGQEEKYDGRTRTYEVSTSAFHPAGEVHSQRIGSEGLRCLHVEFEKQWSNRHPDTVRIIENALSLQSNVLTMLGRRIHGEFRESDDLSNTAVEALMLEIIVETNRFETRRNHPDSLPWLKKARDVLHAQYMETLSLSDIAKAVDIHPVHLARVFRKVFHCSVGDYIRNLRIQAACKAIDQDGDSLAEVGIGVGFSDQAHFTRTFKKVLGLTPSQYREQQRG